MIKKTVKKNLIIEPAIDFELRWEDKNRQLNILPKKPLQDKKYQVILKKGFSFAGTFVKDKIISYYNTLNKAQAHSFPRPKKTKKKIEIDLSNQKFITWQDGKKIGEYLTSTGKWSTPTKAGDFEVITKRKIATGYGDGQVWVMPYWMGVYKVGGQENGIHELPLINGWQEGKSSLGHAVSHGCIRLDIGVAKKVYDWAPTGTPVIIHK